MCTWDVLLGIRESIYYVFKKKKNATTEASSLVLRCHNLHFQETEEWRAKLRLASLIHMLDGCNAYMMLAN